MSLKFEPTLVSAADRVQPASPTGLMVSGPCAHILESLKCSKAAQQDSASVIQEPYIKALRSWIQESGEKQKQKPLLSTPDFMHWSNSVKLSAVVLMYPACEGT